jgi:hypothetical protein
MEATRLRSSGGIRGQAGAMATQQPIFTTLLSAHVKQVFWYDVSPPPQSNIYKQAYFPIIYPLNYFLFNFSLLRFGKWSCLGQQHVLQSIILTSYFYKKYLLKTNICLLLWKYFARQSIHVVNDFKVIHDSYSWCLTQTLSKMTSFTKRSAMKFKWTRYIYYHLYKQFSFTSLHN